MHDTPNHNYAPATLIVNIHCQSRIKKKTPITQTTKAFLVGAILFFSNDINDSKN